MGHHRQLLDCRVRTEAMIRAIEADVRPGDVVCDLGTGTGVLAMAAARAGARRVYAIELGDVAGLARQIVADNGYGDAIEVLHCHSARAAISEPVDVLVSECFGVLGLGSTMIPWLCELRDRVMKVDGRIVPRSVSVHIAAVESRACATYVAPFQEPRYGFRFAAAAELALNNLYSAEFAPAQLITDTAPLITIDLQSGARHDGNACGRARLSVLSDAELCGLAGWFTADLGHEVTLSTAPGRPSTVWRQVFLPTLPRPIRAGDDVEVEVRFVREEERLFDIRWAVSAAGVTTRGATSASYPAEL